MLKPLRLAVRFIVIDAVLHVSSVCPSEVAMSVSEETVISTTNGIRNDLDGDGTSTRDPPTNQSTQLRSA